MPIFYTQEHDGDNNWTWGLYLVPAPARFPRRLEGHHEVINLSSSLSSLSDGCEHIIGISITKLKTNNIYRSDIASERSEKGGGEKILLDDSMVFCYWAVCTSITPHLLY